MTLAVRRRLFLVAAVLLGLVLLGAFADVPGFGRYQGAYGLTLARVAVPQRHATDVVTAVVFDYRGFDTLGEEFILFTAAVGVSMLLRAGRDERERAAREMGTWTTGAAVRAVGLLMVGTGVVVGLDVVTHGHLSPGGGFQGGAILASAAALVFLIGGLDPFRRSMPEALVEVGEGGGVGAYPLIGSLGLLAGGAFLTNVLPLGRPGDLLSAGTIPLLNACVGLAVAAGFVSVFRGFLDQTFAVREGRAR